MTENWTRTERRIVAHLSLAAGALLVLSATSCSGLAAVSALAEIESGDKPPIYSAVGLFWASLLFGLPVLGAGLFLLRKGAKLRKMDNPH